MRETPEALQRRVRRLEVVLITSLTICALCLVVTLRLALMAGTRQPSRAKFDEIDVGRINVVERDGTLRLAISNTERAPGWVFGGKPRPGRPKNAGMIFFDDQGNEDGGLIFGGNAKDGKYEAGASLTFDQHDADQVVALQYNDENGIRRSGLAINEFPASFSEAEEIERSDSLKSMPPGPARVTAQARHDSAQARGELGANRGYFGRDRMGNAILRLSDKTGKPRLRLVVDSLGAARLEFLDAAGRVTRTIAGQ